MDVLEDLSGKTSDVVIEFIAAGPGFEIPSCRNANESSPTGLVVLEGRGREEAGSG